MVERLGIAPKLTNHLGCVRMIGKRNRYRMKYSLTPISEDADLGTYRYTGPRERTRAERGKI